MSCDDKRETRSKSTIVAEVSAFNLGEGKNREKIAKLRRLRLKPTNSSKSIVPVPILVRIGAWVFVA